MRIGFYAPLKAPDHPVPSGDRAMARLLLAALRHANHTVEVYSRLRAYAAEPDAPPLAALRAAAEVECVRLSADWADPSRRPEVLFTYHLHYKAPDLLGPVLAARLGCPYVTAEASLSPRRREGPWGERQALVAAAVRQAHLNLCFTARDRAGLTSIAPDAQLADLAPFTDAAGPVTRAGAAGGAAPCALVTVAMMRPGDKLDSYRCLAAALARLNRADWHLTIVGDGPARPAVEAAFAGLPAGRLRWMGALPSAGVAAALAQADIFAWPGLNEAYGLCYLEAQAAGLPVVAIRNAGTPEVIRHGETGVLTDTGPDAFADALDRLIADVPLRTSLGAAALGFVRNERSLAVAAGRLDALMRDALARWRTR